MKRRNLVAFLVSLLLPVPITPMLSLNTKVSSGTYSKGQNGLTPTLTILVHGLDSSSKTWESTMEKINGPCVAIDQRGSGYSPLGDPKDFSQKALVDDLHRVIENHVRDNEKVVLLGHSLGGRIVLGYAAAYPERVAALIIEDMDIAERSPDTHGVVQLKPYSGTFDRQRENKETLIRALESVGYPPTFIEKGLATGRIEPDPNANPPGSAWVSHINPDFRKLCYEHVLNTPQARLDCERITKLLKNKEKKISFPIHVLVAGKEGTVCLEESIQEMKQILGSDLLIHRYLDAGHSIHSSKPGQYLETVNGIIHQASRAKL